MNETVMILREGKMSGIIMMMKVIIVAIYLCRADAVARLLSLTVANDLSLKHMRTLAHTRAHASRSLTQTLLVVHLLARCHSTTFVKAISGRR